MKDKVKTTIIIYLSVRKAFLHFVHNASIYTW